MSSDRNAVVKILFLCLVEAISCADNTTIASTLLSNTLKNEFLQRAINDARLCLCQAGYHAITQDQAWADLFPLHIVLSIAPNVPKMLDDMKDTTLACAKRDKLQLW